MLEVGDLVPTDTRCLHVSVGDVESVDRMRPVLVEEARAGRTITYGELVHVARLAYPPRRLGRLLILLAEDCRRRGEPSLAAICVTKATGEVGDGYGEGAARDRAAVFAFWGDAASG